MNDLATGGFKIISVIENPLAFDNARGYLVGFDLDNKGNNAYRWKPLIQCLISGIHEFAYGLHEGVSTKNTETLQKLIDAARSIYKISDFENVRKIYQTGNHIDDEIEDKFLRRGEFGELILHLVLREYHNTIPLLSKIYFKDSLGHAVHGFDCVHVDPDSKTLWLGESKLYIDPKRALKELIKDVQEHFTADYMNAEFSLISKKIRGWEAFPLIDEWQRILAGTTKLRDKFSQINIPLLCTYTCDLFTEFDDEKCEAFRTAYEEKVRELKEYFDKSFSHPFAEHLNLFVLLFPVPSKVELVKQLHTKLSMLQALGE